MINEQFLKEDFGGENLVTGQDVADILGVGEMYKKGKEQEMMDSQLKTECTNRFNEFMSRLNEVDKKNARDIID